MLIRLAEDLIFREVETIQIVLHPTQCKGEEAGGEVCRDTNSLITGAVGVVLQHNANTGISTESIRLLFALCVHVRVILNGGRLELVRELTELFVGHVDRDLVLNAVIFHFQSSSQ